MVRGWREQEDVSSAFWQLHPPYSGLEDFALAPNLEAFSWLCHLSLKYSIRLKVPDGPQDSFYFDNFGSQFNILCFSIE